MPSHNGFFCFRTQELIKTSPKRKEECLVLFAGLADIDSSAVVQAIDTALKGTLPPDYVIVLMPEHLALEISEEVKVNQDLRLAFERAPAIKASSIFGYDQTGEISHRAPVKGNPLPFFDQQLLRDDGLRHILEESKTNVLVKAASGFIFSKPSSRSSNYFIRAEGMLCNQEDVTFVAYCLLGFVDRWRKQTVNPIRSIYIDTMGIVSVAMSLIELLRRLDPSFLYPRIESFHSYEGLKKLPPPDRDTSLCVVSASTTCGLADKWVDTTHANRKSVITLLSLAEPNDKHNILLTLSKPDDYLSLLPDSDLGGKSPIGIVGETFWMKPFPTRHVLLNRVVDGVQVWPEKVSLAFEELYKTKALSCWMSVPERRRVFPIHIDGLKLRDSEKYKSWLRNALRDLVPASIKRIVFQSDEASKIMAADAAEYLRSEIGLTHVPEPISDEELAHCKDSWSGAVLIVAAVVGKGSRLLTISRDLRDRQKEGVRIYLVGAAMPVSDRQFSSLKSNLVYPSAAGNRFQAFRTFAIGAFSNAAIASWRHESSQLAKLVNEEDEGAYPELDERISTLDTYSTNDGRAFWGRPKCGTPLALRQTFAYWDFKYGKAKQLHDASQADVLLTVAALLQHYREASIVPSGKRLSSEVFEQVILSPECFYRYNDGVIQAALLRTALPAELDFSGDEEASTQMKSFLLRLANNHDKEHGEALNEFLVSMLCDRLKLSALRLKEFLQELEEVKLLLPKYIQRIVEEIAKANKVQLT